MKILHTSDWHIGKQLFGKKRYDEFKAFFSWLTDLINSEKIDILIVSGDIFDTSTPGNEAQKIYYTFLTSIQNTYCSHVIIIAGNHDSPSFLNAPKDILSFLNIHIVSSLNEDIESRVFELSINTNERKNDSSIIIMAVPYLRDREVRTPQINESIEDRYKNRSTGIKNHYDELYQKAESMRNGRDIPIVATGHLFTRGGKTATDDGVRELYVGNLSHITADTFNENIDYLALGHLHIPQTVNKKENFRYSGSPLPMGFDEIDQKKTVISILFKGRNPIINEHSVPLFQHMKRISGTLDEISSALMEIQTTDVPYIIEVECFSDESPVIIKNTIEEIVNNTKIEIARIKNKTYTNSVLKSECPQTNLNDFNEYEVFEKLLDSKNILDNEKPELINAYRTIIQLVHEEDNNE